MLNNLTLLFGQHSVSWLETQVVTIQPWLNFGRKIRGGRAPSGPSPGSTTGLATPKIHERDCWAGHPLLCSYQVSALLRSSPEVLAQFGCQCIPSLAFRYFATTPSHAIHVDIHTTRSAACNLNRRQSRGSFRPRPHEDDCKRKR